VKVLSGPFNRAGVGSSRPGNRRDRVFDQTRGFSEKTENREKLNHERPARACRSVPSETRGRTAKQHRRRVGETLLVSVPRNREGNLSETAPGREPGTCDDVERGSTL